MKSREYVVEKPPGMEPVHPGVILAEALEHEQVTVLAAAEALGVTRQTLHRILARQGAITPEMAVRIGAFIGNGPGLWLRMQQAHDLWHATRKIQGTRVRPIATIKGLSRVGRPRATAQEGAKSRRRARA